VKISGIDVGKLRLLHDVCVLVDDLSEDRRAAHRATGDVREAGGGDIEVAADDASRTEMAGEDSLADMMRRCCWTRLCAVVTLPFCISTFPGEAMAKLKPCRDIGALIVPSALRGLEALGC